MSYCCYGCRLAESITGQTGEQGAVNVTLVRLGLAVFFTMNVMAFSMALWAQDMDTSKATMESTFAPVLWSLFRYICMLFALPVFFLLAGPLAAAAIEEIRNRNLTIDLLLVIGVTASYVYSAIAVFTETGHVYFEVGCMILLMVTIGRLLEAQGKVQTTQAIESLSRLLPDNVRVIEDGRELECSLTAVQKGSVVRVRPGETIPLDGVVRNQQAAIDEQILTGESVPRLKEIGDAVHAGTVNLDRELELTVTLAHDQGTVAKLVEMVRTACLRKGRYQRLADRTVVWFIPLIMVLALGTFGYHGRFHGFEHGLKAGLAVLLIACPCALGLATPMAVWAALGRMAQRQILCQSGDSLERLAEVRTLRFDKTGTLTTGKMTVRDARFSPASETARLLRLAGQLANRSSHPASQAIVRYYQQQQDEDITTTGQLEEVENLPGLGVRAVQADTGSQVLLGSKRFVSSSAHWPDDEPLALHDIQVAAGFPCVCLAERDTIVGVFILDEQLRDDAQPAIAALQKLGIDVAVLTGDHRFRACAIAQTLGVAVRGEMLPEDKVSQLMEDRRRLGTVAMVGDGINDAPALAIADVGIAMGCGADISRQSASVCLLSDSLMRLPWMVGFARQTRRIIRQNLFWAFAYNIVALGFAVTGRLNPVLAALAMVLSSAMVVVNSLRLRRYQVIDEPESPK